MYVHGSEQAKTDGSAETESSARESPGSLYNNNTSGRHSICPVTTMPSPENTVLKLPGRVGSRTALPMSEGVGGNVDEHRSVAG